MKKAFPSDWDNEVEVVEPVTVRSNIYKCKKESLLGDIIENVGASPVLFLTMAGFGFLLGYSVTSAAPNIFHMFFWAFLAFAVVTFMKFYSGWKNDYVPTLNYQGYDKFWEEYWEDRDVNNPTGIYNRMDN